MRYTIFLVLVLAFLLSACGEIAPTPPSNERRYLFGDVQYPSYPVRYFKDERTGLCFAERMFGTSDSYSFTNVPCPNVDAYYKVNPNTNTATNANTNTNTKEQK